MNRTVIALFGIFTILLTTIFYQCGKKENRTIRIYGSTTLEPFMKKAVQEFEKAEHVGFSIDAVGSKNGIDSLIENRCDIAMSSMEILPEQTALARKKGISIKPYLLAYDIIVPIVHPSNPASDISFDNLKRIFEGKITRWSALGGKDTAVDAVDRSDASGTYSVWHHYIAPAHAAGEPGTVSQTNNSVLAYVSEHVNAIGYVSNAFVNPEVKALKLGGISLEDNDARLSEYHLKRPLYLYVNEEKFDSDREARLFVIFLIISDKGRNLLRKSGFFFNYWAGPYHPELP